MEFLKSHSKEKADMILEPMQVMIQLSILSFEPIGTKIHVSRNILSLQRPTYFQGIERWWNSDNKDDLYYLFHAIRRYYKWYKNQEDEIFDYILRKAIQGIDRLIETYTRTDKISIRQTLSLYKNILDMEEPALFKDESEQATSIDKVFENITSLYNEEYLNAIYNILLLMDRTEGKQDLLTNYSDGLYTISLPMHSSIQTWIQTNLTC
jgi:hypothetical protein|tara:strand:- start:41 stop:667 length:627 start_codon:yes stop_codon:yes gene_type:complete